MKILDIKTEERLLGSFGERAAVKFLKKNGYRIREKNYVFNEHEIDIIAEDRDTYIFVEVKTRHIEKLGTYEARPASAVTREKQQGIILAASAYSKYYSYVAPKRARLDIIEVYVSGDAPKWKIEKIKHLISAFDKNTAFKPKWQN